MATPEAAPPPPPIERILPYVASLLSAGLSFASAFTRFLSVLLSSSLTFFSPLPLIAYLFAPLIVFLDVLTDIAVRWPHRLALYALDALYPVYVFCGVACIVGVLLGTAGRVVAVFLVQFFVGKEGEGARPASMTPRPTTRTYAFFFFFCEAIPEKQIPDARTREVHNALSDFCRHTPIEHSSATPAFLHIRLLRSCMSPK
ncbi:hypothetical protein LshimejAT787_1700100 [Lyophyllum shimeji]|uniref:Uncharacterized protein n=1 Tax=Lyophyllum shimeji TaxID=47721 RepID=A0A9P3PYI4_LYOSH|nr:hypothetical protein LshimejAT787_1700100 [Lyophyllum shimeji]